MPPVGGGRIVPVREHPEQRQSADQEPAMVQPYPTAAQMPSAERPSVPSSVRNAATVMYVGAAAAVIHSILYIVTSSATKTAYADKHPRLSATKITAGAHALTFSGAVGGVIAAALFIWIAVMCLRGRNWARITGTVFFGIGVVDALLGLIVAVSVVDKIFSFVVVLIGLGAIILLWQASSSEYFRSSARPPV
jgi:hypothetical protein